MDTYYVITIVVLVGLCVYFWYERGENSKRFNKEMSVTKKESVTQKKDSEEKVKEILELAKAQEAATIKHLNAQHSSVIGIKNKEIENMKKFSLNRGEMITDQVLKDIKESLMAINLVGNDEMIIGGNLFIPYTDNNNHQVRQIDHIVLLPTNIFIIETKYWKGKIVHGLSKKNAGKLSFLLDELFPKSSNDKENVFLFSSKETDNEQNEVSLYTYDNPVTQVRKSAMKLKAFLTQKNSKFNLVRTIVYYGYPKNSKNYVIDLSHSVEKKGILDTEIITEKNELEKIFRYELENEKPKYTANELTEIMRIILEFNKLV